MKKGLFYAILASVLWAIVNPFIKQGLSYDFSPMNFAGIRFTTVGIILFAYTWHKGMWKEIRLPPTSSTAFLPWRNWTKPVLPPMPPCRKALRG